MADCRVPEDCGAPYVGKSACCPDERDELDREIRDYDWPPFGVWPCEPS